MEFKDIFIFCSILFFLFPESLTRVEAAYGRDNTVTNYRITTGLSVFATAFLMLIFYYVANLFPMPILFQCIILLIVTGISIRRYRNDENYTLRSLLIWSTVKISASLLCATVLH